MEQDTLDDDFLAQIKRDIETGNKERKAELLERLGPFPKEETFRSRMRVHQGWWRMSVLNELPGEHPKREEELICNTIYNGKETGKNFLNNSIFEIAINATGARKNNASGLMNEERLFDNLLSSQPLSFNFFGPLVKQDLALKILNIWWGDVEEVISVHFEFSSKNHVDNSAFDVAFEVRKNNQLGLIGLECKYTDEFSFRPSKSQINYGDIGSKNHDKYKALFDKSRQRFKSSYYEFVRSKKYNQLFRNEMIAAAVSDQYSFVYTGILCHQEDTQTIEAAMEFKNMINENFICFQIISYAGYISNVQRLELSWQEREWSMLLWSRYCATSLSQAVQNAIQ